MSAATLKKIAVITMLIDHVAVAFFCIFTSNYDGSAAFAGADTIYQVMRIIGRTSFPLFCFLLVEGFCHTKSVRKYLLRLFVFACLSEVPFDLAFFDKIWDFSMQNVFFTLFFAVAAMECLHRSEKSEVKRLRAAWMLGVVVCTLAAYVLRTDYSWKGVILVLLLYVFRYQRIVACFAGYAAMCLLMLSSWGFPAFFLMNGYNGKKGNGSKYFFYVFYPVHILVLAGIRIWVLKYL